MKRYLVASTLAIFLVLTTQAFAVPVTFTLDSYVVNYRSVDPGLVLFVNDSTPLVSFGGDLSIPLPTVGSTYTHQLFRIGTSESNVGLDDLVFYPISVTFYFSQPPPPFGGVDTGTSFGWTVVILDGGIVTWNDPVNVNFGPLNDGILSINLNNVLFGVPGSAIVSATFGLVHDATPAPQPVPEPASLFLLGSGLAGMSVLIQRRRIRK